MSSDSHSYEHSSSLFKPFVALAFSVFILITLSKRSTICCKCCHLAEYATLGLLIFRALSHSRTNLPPWSWPRVGGTLLIVFLYAATDEYHQSFVPTRTPLFSDVCICLSGGYAATRPAAGLDLSLLAKTQAPTMKRPFVIVVSFYAIGLLLAEFFQPSLPSLFAGSFLVLVLTFIFKKKIKAVPALRFCSCSLAGPIWFFTRRIFLPMICAASLAMDRPLQRCTERRCGRPRQTFRTRWRRNRTFASPGAGFPEIRMDKGWQLKEGAVMVSTPGSLSTNYFTGQSVEISGVVAQPPLPLARGLFNDREYLKTHGIYYVLKTSSVIDWYCRN